MSLLEQPKSPEFEQFRQVLRREFLEKVLSILNEHLDIDVYEEVKIALEKRLK